jgi:integrase
MGASFCALFLCKKIDRKEGGNWNMKNVKAILNPVNVIKIYTALQKRHPRFGLLWLMGMETGLRVSDLLELQMWNIRPALESHSPISIYETKTGKVKRIALGLETISRLKNFSNIHGLLDRHYIFFSSASNKEKPITRQWAHRLIARTASKMGLNFVGTHSMRKIYACNLYRTTNDLKAVQRDLNHKYISTTLLYLADLLPGNT